MLASPRCQRVKGWSTHESSRKRVRARTRVVCSSGPAHAADSLYIGDDSDYTVKRFDAETGAFLGSFVSAGSGGVNGLTGCTAS